MSAENQLRTKFEEIKAMGAQDTTIDTASLMVNALDEAQRDAAERRKYRVGYWISALFPPVGLIFAIVYALNGRPSGRRAAVWCVVWTVAPLVLLYGMMAAFVGSLGPETLKQLESINVSDYQGLLE